MWKVFISAFFLSLSGSYFLLPATLMARGSDAGVTAADFTLQYVGKDSNQTLSLYERYFAKEGTFKVLAIAFLSASSPVIFKEIELLAAEDEPNNNANGSGDASSDDGELLTAQNGSETIKGLKLLTALYESYHEKGFELLLIVSDKDPGKVAVFSTLREKKKYRFPFLWDRHGIVFGRYKVAGLPQTTLVGADGKIFKVERNYSVTAGREFNALIRKNLGLPSDAPLPPALEKLLKSK